MLDRWFSTIKLPLSLKQFHQLPQNPAFKYEYINKTAWLSPSPKSYSARLALHPQPAPAPESVDIDEAIGFRRLEEVDWARLTHLFAGAFSRVQPYAGLSDRRRLASARACLNFTREGGDGPIINPACHVAFNKEHDRCLGAIFVTLIPLIDVHEFWSMRWQAPPPPDCIERGLGRPHLTWVFVNPTHAGHGIGSALLAHASKSLLELGYSELISSFLLGNTSSMLWHWRNGFELLPYVGSARAMRARWKKAGPAAGSSD